MTSNTKTFYSQTWNFSLTYPAEWEVIYQDEPAGSWTIPIAVAGADVGSGRPCFMVNARHGEILQGSSHMPVFAVGPDGQPIKMPSTPAEYIEMNKQTLRRDFPGFQFLSAEEIRLAHKPAARLVYSYRGQRGRITEESITMFGVGVTFQFICEVPSTHYSTFQSRFQHILDSFRIGREMPEDVTVAEEEPEAVTADLSSLQLYNQGANHYRNGDFEKALAAFEGCFRSGEYQLQAAYARALCQQELGREIEIPEELGDQAEAAGPAYVATTLACYLMDKGHQAAVTKQDKTSDVEAHVGGAHYRISIISGFGFGGFFKNAWRKEGDKYIPLTDRSVNPNPTEADRFVISLVERAHALPPQPLPEEGLKTSLEPLAPEEPPAPAEAEVAEVVAEDAGEAAPEVAVEAVAPVEAGAPVEAEAGPTEEKEEPAVAVASAGPQRMDFIVPRGQITLAAGSLTFRRGQLSSETVSLPLDSLRLVYLFLPKEFKWRLIKPSQYHYQWINLDALSDEAFSELCTALAQQHRSLVGDFSLVLADFEGRATAISWKKLAKSGIDLMAELRRYREARREKRTRWLQGNPSLTVGAKGSSSRADISLNTAGVAQGRNKFIPWNALAKIEITQFQSPLGDTCFFHFIPAKDSGLKKIRTGVAPKQTEACLAEFDFWRLPDQAQQLEAAVAEPPAQPAAPPVHAGPERTSPLAVVSLATGIATWFLLPLIGAIVAVITGHLARREIRNSGGGVGGKRLANIGLALGYGHLALVVLVALLLLVSRPSEREKPSVTRVTVTPVPTRQIVVIATPTVVATRNSQATATAEARQATVTAQMKQATVTAQSMQATVTALAERAAATTQAVQATATARAAQTATPTSTPRPTATVPPTVSEQGPEEATATYFEAMRQRDFEKAASLLSDFSLTTFGTDRESVRLGFEKRDFDGWLLIDYQIKTSYLLDGQTALVRVFTKQQNSEGEEPQTYDYYIALRYEDGEWRPNLNKLIYHTPLDVPEQTVNGVTVQVTWLVRYTDKVQLYLNIENTNERNVIWGDVQGQTAMFHFPDQDKDISFTQGYVVGAGRTLPNINIFVAGFYEAYPTAVDLLNWRWASQESPELPDKSSEPWSYTFTLKRSAP